MDNQVTQQPPQPDAGAERPGQLRDLWSWAGEPSSEALSGAVGPRHTPSGFVTPGTQPEPGMGVGEHPRHPAPLPVPPPVPPPPAEVEPAPDEVPEPARRVPLIALLAVGAAVVVLVGGAVVLGGGRSRPARTTAAITSPAGSPTGSPVTATAAPSLSPTARATGHPTPAHRGPATSGHPAPSPTARAAKPFPDGQPYTVANSTVGLNLASGHGCKGWLKGQNPGPQVEAWIQSWGDDCQMALYRSPDGGPRFNIMSGTHRISAGTGSTHFYADNDPYLARVCLNDFTTGQGDCGPAHGGQKMATGG